jgi:hypothetical protein
VRQEVRELVAEDGAAARLERDHGQAGANGGAQRGEDLDAAGAAPGHEADENYRVSMVAGEKHPASRRARRRAGLADRHRRVLVPSQIAHGSDRSALHLAQVQQLALRGAQTARHAYPERATVAH